VAQTYREVRRTTVREPNVIERDVIDSSDYGMTTAARIVSLIGGTIMAFLGLRFILSLLGANPANAFAHFIYSVSHPFVAPFFGLFNYRGELGIVRFEFETLIAILFWGFVTWMIVRLLTVGVRE
jgi:YggT family protein